MDSFNKLDYVLIKTKLGNSAIKYTKIIKHNGEKFEYEDFLISAAIELNTSVYNISHFEDSEGITIPDDKFLEIIVQNYSHPKFLLKIILKDHMAAQHEQIQPNVLAAAVEKQNARMGLELYITHDELKHFIMESDNSFVLRKIYVTNQQLIPIKDVERRAIIREAVNFLVKKFGWYPENYHKQALAFALIKLFPQLKSSKGGIELLFDANSGFIPARLYNIRSKARLTDNVRRRKSRSEICDDVKEVSSITNLENDEGILILKNCNVNTQWELIKKKLRETLEIRNAAFEKPDFFKISKEFPFFFLKPELILYDFNIRFPENSEGLLQNWDWFSSNVEKIFNDCATINFEESVLISEWFPGVKLIFLLIKLLPQTAAGKSSAKISRDRYIECLQKLIIFKTLNLTTDELIEKNSPHPCIIATGENKMAISNYYICIEQEIFTVPSEYNFPNVLDCFFKSHYVFNQHFPASLKNFWDFMSCYLYKMELKYKVSNRVQEIISKFDQKLNISNN